LFVQFNNIDEYKKKRYPGFAEAGVLFTTTILLNKKERREIP
jgi:hypothetical protein